MWKDFFYYTRGEQRGIVVLLVLIGVVLVGKLTLPYWIPKHDLPDWQKQYVAEVYSLNDSLQFEAETRKSDSLFFFNPNKINSEELSLLGFSPSQSKAYLSYRSKLGSFKNVNFIYKVYGLDSTKVNKLRPYMIWEISKPGKKARKFTMEKHIEIVWVNFNKVGEQFLNEQIASEIIKDSIRTLLLKNKINKSLPLSKVQQYSDKKLLSWLLRNKSHSLVKESKQQVEGGIRIELNAADTIQLKCLKGIGSKLACRIVKYRNLLGGFYRIEQLKEVYGISADLFVRVKAHVFVDVKLIDVIKFDNKKVSEISKHPYFEFDQAVSLFNLYRKRKRLYKRDIVKLKSINEEDWDRIQYYLEFE